MARKIPGRNKEELTLASFSFLDVEKKQVVYDANESKAFVSATLYSLSSKEPIVRRIRITTVGGIVSTAVGCVHIRRAGHFRVRVRVRVVLEGTVPVMSRPSTPEADVSKICNFFPTISYF